MLPVFGLEVLFKTNLTMAILNYTTKIASEKSIAEITQILTKRGVRKVMVDYNDRGLATELSFTLEFKGQMIAFALPCYYQGVLASMKKSKVEKRWINDEQALRTAWRILKDWVAAQMAIIDAEMASMTEVFLPYAVMKEGKTLYQFVSESPSKLLLQSENP